MMANLVLLVTILQPQNATNGVYGGYVGSDRWFAMMRSTAANQAILRSLGKSADPRALPPDYVEFAGAIVFPGGKNPFSGGRFPDLRIVATDKAADKAADSVERAPFIDENGGFYTVFKKAQTYNVSWMYYFGSREMFSSITVPANSPRQVRQAIEYKTPAPAATTIPAETPRSSAAAPQAEAKPPIPPNVNTFDLSGVPRRPTTLEEQQILDDVSDPASYVAHERLARYYEKKGDKARAAAEYAKARYWRNPGAYAPVPRGEFAAPAASVRRSEIDEPPAVANIPENPTSVAVIIGIGNYREASIPGLPYAVQDAEVFRRYVESAAGIRKENIKLLTDNGATRSDIEDVVERWLPFHTEATSQVYFYYAGHGAIDPATGETYLVPYEGIADAPATRMYPVKRLYDRLSGLKAQSVTVFLDSCFSGAGGRSVGMRGRPIVINASNAPIASGKVSVLAAASGNQISSDLDRAGHGLFTYFLLRGIRGEADSGRDGWVDLDELYSFVRENVSRTARTELDREQTPVLNGPANTRLFRLNR